MHVYVDVRERESAEEHHSFGAMLTRRAVGDNGGHDACAALREAADDARQQEEREAVRHAPYHFGHGETHL